MGQKGFFDIAQRYAGLDAKNDPLARIDEVVPWEDFRPRLEAAWRKPTEERKSPAGRKPWDAVVMFKAIVLCELYNLSDDPVEYQLRDRLSFMRFLGLGLEDKVPDAKTVWLYREQLAQAGVIETLFEDFDGYLEQQGYLAMGGQIIDASIVPVPKQRNSGDDNARIKEGETPEGWFANFAVGTTWIYPGWRLNYAFPRMNCAQSRLIRVSFQSPGQFIRLPTITKSLPVRS